MSHYLQKSIRMHLIEKEKDLIASNTTLMVLELSRPKVRQRGKISLKKSSFIIRYVKAWRGKWDDKEFKVNYCKEIYLLPDSMIDKYYIIVRLSYKIRYLRI